MSDATPENHESNSTVDVVNVEPPASNELRESTMESDIGKGISSIISSVISDFDSQAEQTIRSQDHLSSSIDRLTGELDQLLEDAPLPFIMQHAAKISGVRKRVSSLNSVLKSIQRRVDNIDRMVSAGPSHEKTTSGNSGHH